MVYEILMIGGVLIFFVMEGFFLYSIIRNHKQEKKEWVTMWDSLIVEEKELNEKMQSLEAKMGEVFSFYELARKLAPILDREKLLSIFMEEVGGGEYSERIKVSSVPLQGDYMRYPLDEQHTLCVKDVPPKLRAYLPHFAKLLGLCLERITLYRRLQELSIHDGLTNTYNRRYGMIRFHEEFQRSKKFNFSCAFLMIDIDYFKKINDTYGHLVGDVVLREVAQSIQKSVREIDFVARFGGEEFFVILPETDKMGAIMVSERIRSDISQRKIRAFDEVLSATISIGVAAFPESTLYPDMLIEVADKALYKAKISGRNKVCWF